MLSTQFTVTKVTPLIYLCRSSQKATLEQERRREHEKRRSASLSAAAAKVAKKALEAERAAERAREEAAEDNADQVMAERAEARAKELAAEVEGRATGVAPAAALGWVGDSAKHGASREDVRRGMVWSFVLGVPRATAPYSEEEAGIPGLER